MKLQIDIKNYNVNYIGFSDAQQVRAYLKQILPLDYLNIKIKEGLDIKKWDYFFTINANEKYSPFRYSMNTGILLDDVPSIVRTYRDTYYNISII